MEGKPGPDTRMKGRAPQLTGPSWWHFIGLATQCHAREVYAVMRTGSVLNRMVRPII